MTLPEDWKKINLPLGLTVAAVGVVWGSWIGLHAEFVMAQEYKQFKQTLEIRGLERDKKVAENEILKLEIKQETYPKKFDAIDKAILKKQKKDLAEIHVELKKVQGTQ